MEKRAKEGSQGANPSAEAETAEAVRARSEASLIAFREALERSVTIPRDRLQEVVDDAVRRGRMTRGDAEELVSRLVSRGREQAEDIVSELERLLSQIRDELTSGMSGSRQTAGRAAERARRELEDAAEHARREVGTRVERGTKRRRGR